MLKIIQLIILIKIKIRFIKNYQNYISGKDFSYYGGYTTENPYRINIPSSNHWYVIIDNGDDVVTGITSSVKVKTIGF